VVRGLVPVLHAEAEQRAQDPADQDDRRKPRLAQADRLGQAVDREGRVGVDPPEAGGVRRLGGGEQVLRLAEFGQQAVDAGFTDQDVTPSSWSTRAAELPGPVPTCPRWRDTSS